MKENLNFYHDITITTEDGRYQLMVDNKLTSTDYYIQTMHTHSVYELFYVVKGTMDIICGGNTLTLTKHTMLVVPPELLHHAWSDDPGLQRYIISFRISDITEKHPLYSLFHSMTPIFFRNPADIENAFERFGRYYKEHPAVRCSLMAVCFHEILCLLKKEMIVVDPSGNSNENKALLRSMSSDRDYRNYVIDLYINKNFNRNISLKELSELLYMSERHTDRVVSAMYGQSFHERVIYLRMENAIKLLAETNMSVKAIAATIGFQSANGFYRSFGKTYGMTPGEYRDKTKKEI